MMSTKQFEIQKSLQWMKIAGADADEVDWLEGMMNTKEIHSKCLRARVDQIYISAITGMLSGDAVEQLFIQAQLN